MRYPVKLFASAAASVLAITLAVAPGSVAKDPAGSSGAPGVGDPYFPLDGNGGYDVGHYDLGIRYYPSTDWLVGTATIRARATKKLTRFNLDLVGLNVRAIVVDGRRADWSRDGDELTVEPRRGLRRHSRFTTVIERTLRPTRSRLKLDRCCVAFAWIVATPVSVSVAGA